MILVYFCIYLSNVGNDEKLVELNVLWVCIVTLELKTFEILIKKNYINFHTLCYCICVGGCVWQICLENLFTIFIMFFYFRFFFLFARLFIDIVQHFPKNMNNVVDLKYFIQYFWWINCCRKMITENTLGLVGVAWQ